MQESGIGLMRMLIQQRIVLILVNPTGNAYCGDTTNKQKNARLVSLKVMLKGFVSSSLV